MPTSVTVIPSNYSDMTNFNVDSTYTINRAYTNSSSTTFTRMNIPAGLVGSIYFLFDTSAIPSDAVIQGVTAQFKARINATNRVLYTGAQLYSGNTPKGSSTAFASTTASVRSITAGTWDRNELNDLRLFVTGTASTGGTTRRIDFYGADVTITYISGGYAKVIQATQLAVQIANDPSHGYNQKARYGPDFDCSSLVSYCLQQAGFNIDPHGTATRNLAGKLAALGFTNVISQVDVNTGQGLEYGDILLTVTKHHTEFSLGYIPNNQIVEAVHDEHGGKGGSNTQPGDQTGDEIRIRTFYRYQWEYVFRWTDGGGGYIPDNGSFVIRIPKLRRGYKYAVVAPVQSLLQGLYRISVGPSGVDGDFGKDTEKAVKEFQQKNGLEVDGIVGEKTMEKLLKL